MVSIPGGAFSMGATEQPGMNDVGMQATTDSRPIHRVYIDLSVPVHERSVKDAMDIERIFANISCSNLDISLPWYQKLFGAPPTRRPMDGLAEWQFTDSAEVQLHENKANAGMSTVTLGVLSIESEHQRLAEQGLAPGPIETTKDFLLARITDPDGNLVVMVSGRRS